MSRLYHSGDMPYQSDPSVRLIAVFDINGVRMGINICADSRKLDTIEALAAQGVEVVHNPHANIAGNMGLHAAERTRGKLVYYFERVIRSRANFHIQNMAGDAV